jgi:hypothetical protein
MTLATKRTVATTTVASVLVATLFLAPTEGSIVSAQLAMPTRLSAQVAVPATTATYVWVLPNARPAATKLAGQLKKKGVKEAYLAEPYGKVSKSQAAYVKKLRSALGKGGKVHALIGPGCTDVSSVGDSIFSAWMRMRKVSKVYDGVVTDYEPWTCKGWNKRVGGRIVAGVHRRALIAQYLRVLKLGYAQRAGKPFVASISAGLYTVKDPVTGTPLSTQVLKRTTGIVIMSYWNSYANVKLAAGTELKAAKAAHRTARIAVCIEKPGPGLAKANTFWDNPGSLHGVLLKLNKNVASTAVEDWSSWKKRIA